MRKISAALAVLGLAALGAVVPATAAHAGPNCDAKWNNLAPGYFVAYGGTDCYGDVLGWTESYDTNWGNDAGPFQGGDTNQATSILQKGTSWMAVKIYNETGDDWGGSYSCLTRGVLYASDLSNDRFSSGAIVNNAISSHKWVPQVECFGEFVQ